MVLFGAKRLPDLAKGLGQGITEFKKASKNVTDESSDEKTTQDTKPPTSKDS